LSIIDIVVFAAAETAAALSEADEERSVKFGMFYEWPNPARGDWKRLFEEGVEQIQYAEEMGYDFVLVAEHHFSNYGQSPAPLLQALHIAQRTRRLKIATAVLVLPVWQPLRLAEEIAVLDNLTDGRFICGIGRGYQPHEFGRFGVTNEDSRGRFDETLDVLIRAWSSNESFTYDGNYVKIPTPVVVWPKPLQKPHPPLWLAGTSADSIRLAAERDIVPITTGFVGPSGVLKTAAAWAQARLDLGKPLEGLEMGVQTTTHVADSDAEARTSMHYARWQNRANRALQRQDVSDGAVNAIPYEGELNDDDFFNGLYFGSPDSVIEKFRRLSNAGGTIVSTWMMVGGMEHEKLMKSIRLMGQEVIPALRDVHPPKHLLEELASGPSVASADHATSTPPPT
jgi:alkanesulfonate monooxygenase SsuD/methylene tetrahydromethanopterin reductase-like flavin-dependent oxidoreductase (luciferase family)